MRSSRRFAQTSREQLPMLDVEFMQLLQDMIGDLTSAPEPVEIKLFSEDAALLRQWAPKVGDAISKVNGVVDVLNGIDNTISGPALTFRVDPVLAARAGFSAEEVELDASAIIQGEPAPTPVILNDRPYTIRVRYPEQARNSLDAIKNTLLVSASGKTATLGSLATLTESPGQTEIRRENLQRDVAVTARLEGVSLGTGMDAVKKAVANVNLPPSIRVEYGGGYEEQQRSFRDLAVVLALAIVLVFTVLLFEFGGFAAPVAILSSALLSTSGVFLALLITRHDVQHLVVHGPDHGDRNRREERDSTARCGSAVPCRRHSAHRGDGHGRRAAATAHPDDGAGYGGGNGPAGAGLGRGIADAAAACDRGHRRRSGVDDPFAGGDAGCELLPRGAESLRQKLNPKSAPTSSHRSFVRTPGTSCSGSPSVCARYILAVTPTRKCRPVSRK